MDPTDQASERFITAAVRPFKDNVEMQTMAGQELRHMIAAQPSSAERDASLEAAAIGMETSSRFAWKKWLYLVTAVVSVIVAVPVVRDYQRLRLASWGLFAMTDPFVTPLPGLPLRGNVNERIPELIGDFSPQQKLLLFGESRDDYLQNFKPLWNSDPENPAYFIQHVLAVSERGEPLPPRFLETADQLDPGNAWFRQLAAAAYARDSIRPYQRPRGTPRTAIKAPAYSISDPAKAAKAIRLLKEATTMPDFRSYQDETLLERLKVLPHGEDILERKFVDAYLDMSTPQSRWAYRELDRLLAAASREFATRRSSQEFVDLVQAWEALRLRALDNPEPSPWPGHLRPSEEIAKEVAFAASTLGQPEIAAKYSSLGSEIRAERERERSKLNEVHPPFDRGRVPIGPHGTSFDLGQKSTSTCR